MIAPDAVNVKLPFVDPGDEALIALLMDAHRRAAENNVDNASRVIAENVYYTSNDFTHSVIAAIASVGGPHAPLAQARKAYRSLRLPDVIMARTDTVMIPGYGHSFYKDKIDPAFLDLAFYLGEKYPQAYARIMEIQGWLKDSGCEVQPNAAIFTAAVCEIVGVPDGFEIAFFIMARLPVWAEQCFQKQRISVWA